MEQAIMGGQTAQPTLDKSCDRVYSTYLTVHRQGFLPIFTDNGFDPRRLVESCVEAGCQVIEYTMRRRDIREMIPWIRRNFPHLKLLIGSSVEHDGLLQMLRRRYPHLLSLDELADLDVDGFISMYSWRCENIARYCPTHLVVPTAMTLMEAVEQFTAGAHFIKMIGPDLTFPRWCYSDGVYKFCPNMLTGGMTLECLAAAVDAGVSLIGTGFEVLLRGMAPDAVTVQGAAAIVRQYLDAVREARERRWPELKDSYDAAREEWLAALPHCHHF